MLFDNILPLETERLVLRELVPEQDEDALCVMLNASDYDFAAYMSVSVDEAPFDKDYVRETQLIQRANTAIANSYVFAFLKRDGQEAALIGMFGHSIDHTGSDHLSYYILPKHRQNGYAQEGYDLLTAHMERAGHSILYAEVLPERKASQAFLKANGFRDMGVSPSFLPHRAGKEMLFFLKEPDVGV